MFKSDKRLYLAPDGRLSEEPVTGGTLLVGAGSELSNELAERYGLLESKPLRSTETKAAGKKKSAAPPTENSGEPEDPQRSAAALPDETPPEE